MNSFSVQGALTKLFFERVETVQHIIFECEKHGPQIVAILDLFESCGLGADTVSSFIKKETFPVFAYFARETLWLRMEKTHIRV